MCTILKSGLLWYPGIFNIERAFSGMPEGLKDVLHTKSYSLINPPVVTNDIGNIPGDKGMLFAVSRKHQVQSKLLLLDFTHAHIPRLSPGFWSKGLKYPRRCQRRWWEEGVVLTGGTTYNRLFRLRL